MFKIEYFYFKLINSIFDITNNYINNYIISNTIKVKNKSKFIFNPVTNCDIYIENLIRNKLKLLNIRINVLGEEHKTLLNFNNNNFNNNNFNNFWIIDPIDGTKSFLIGSPLWGTVIGLLINKKIILGGLNHYITNERFIAIGKKTYYLTKTKTGSLIVNCNKKSIKNYIISTTSFNLMSNKQKLKFIELEKKVLYVLYNYDCYALTLLLKSRIDAIIECKLKLHDFLGLIPIIKNSGALICTWYGTKINLKLSSSIIISRTKLIQDNIILILNNKE